MDIVVTPDGLEGKTGTLVFGEFRCRCALGRGGTVSGKREGDGATPLGRFPLRRILYRPDRLDPPRSVLSVTSLSPEYGWCDDPGDSFYNQPVTLPHEGHCESLWREDAVYDVIVVLGHNDAPVHPGMGSAIFLHLATSDYAPTEGCVAVTRDDLLGLLAAVEPETAMEIRVAEKNTEKN
ncbi:MAG: L,D-transpeptidase family protein [Alphaproteobacteria bacterium]|nr:L,D-transpeptidase family protein [Alphaproteobacteria bacterium]